MNVRLQIFILLFSYTESTEGHNVKRQSSSSDSLWRSNLNHNPTPTNYEEREAPQLPKLNFHPPLPSNIENDDPFRGHLPIYVSNKPLQYTRMASRAPTLIQNQNRNPDQIFNSREGQGANGPWLPRVPTSLEDETSDRLPTPPDIQDDLFKTVNVLENSRRQDENVLTTPEYEQEYETTSAAGSFFMEPVTTTARKIDFFSIPPEIEIDLISVQHNSIFDLDKDSIHNFTCTKQTKFREVILLWKLNNRLITEGVNQNEFTASDHFIIQSEFSTKINSSFTLACLVKQNPKLLTLIYLRVKELPTINVSNNSIAIGNNVSLQCDVTSRPSPQIVWYGPGIENGSITNSLVFSPLLSSAVGRYICKVKYSDNKETSQEFNLKPASELIQTQESNIGPIIGGVIGCLLFILALVLLAFYLQKKYHKKSEPPNIFTISYPFQPPSTIEKENEIYDDNVLYDLPPVNDDISVQLYEEIPLDKELHVPDDALKIDEVLGEGSFGQVYRAVAKNLNGHNTSMVVAIKMLKENPTEDDRDAFTTEINMCKSLPAHENIIAFHGSFYKNGLVGIIYDYASNGTLKDMLQKSRNFKKQRFIITYNSNVRLTSRNLINFAYQIACAMRLLSGNGFLHKELAARNILLDENLVCKITHFTSMRNITETHIYEMKTSANLPVRWLSLESLTFSLYTLKSDVWSFGILLWEIITLGAVPYYDIETGPEVKAKIEKGQRMMRPPHCTEELFAIISSCWESDPRHRPSFDEIVLKLEILLRTDIEHIKLEQYETRNFEGVAKDIFRENWE